MRGWLRMIVALSGLLIVAPPGAALERTTALLGEDENAVSWHAGSSCYLFYYNVCTGSVRVWSGWNPGDRFGVRSITCCDQQAFSVDLTWIFVRTGSPSGYGFTGNVALHSADVNGCPIGSPIHSQSFLPTSGWNLYFWGFVVPDRFAVTVTIGPGAKSPAAMPNCGGRRASVRRPPAWSRSSRRPGPGRGERSRACIARCHRDHVRA